jgi:hypothetical protein
MSKPGSVERKEQIRRYKETPRPAGIYRVMHVASGRCIIGASPDAPAMINRQLAQLGMGSHPSAALQRDWNADGRDAFSMEVLDTLEPTATPDYDAAADLEELEALWREKLGLAADHKY